jgi:NADPH oxidase 5
LFRSFRPGDYISINLPRVALYEFHPFTISSAPEETDYIRVHIQAVGNWTKRVYQRFKAMSDIHDTEHSVRVYRADLYPEQSNMYRCDTDNSEQITSNEQVRARKREPIVINGPYSSCARYIFDCEHVVLIGGGIGITPYASILSSIMAQFRASRIVCQHCNGINYRSKRLMETHRLRKVDFIWVNRDHKTFEWFLNLLRQFEQEQEDYLSLNTDEKRFLDIHLYFTEIKHDENIGHAPLDLISKAWSDIAGQDIFTSLKSKTHIGRPKWADLFAQLTSSTDSVNVFFCGPSSMATTIRNHCATYRFRFYEEKF